MTTTSVLPIRDEAFYLERFKECVKNRNYSNGRLLDEDYYCEIYKGFAIVNWKQTWQTPNGSSVDKYTNWVWEVGGVLDHAVNLAWLAQGIVTAGFTANTLDKALKKVRKKVDLLSLVYSRKHELQQLASIYVPRISSNSQFVFNANVNDVVAIRAFGRSRAGIVVATKGNNFVVAYMTPSNPHECHYKLLPLSQLFPKD